MRFFVELRSLLADARFRRLFAVRVTSQSADGVFQLALTSYLLFSPERQPDALSIAGALAAVLLPFSALGPFTGVFLDRWPRQQVLLWCNVTRLIPLLGIAALISAHRTGVPLYALAIVSFSINRFLLAGLSAALPHVVEPRELVLANSVTPTAGTLAFFGGLGAGTLARGILPWGDGAILAAASLIYLLAAVLALRIPVRQLGPDPCLRQVPIGSRLSAVVGDLRSGLRHLRGRPTASHALAAIAAHRFGYGLSTVATILLYRGYFHPPAATQAAFTGLSTAVLVSGVGFFAAALFTPVATARISAQTWIAVLLLIAAACQVLPGGLYTESGVLVAAFVLGVTAQGVKICVDTLVQRSVDDEFRGRVFALYDVAFNVVFVAAAAVGAVVLPDNGKSYAVLGLVAAGYALTAVLYRRAERPSGGELAVAC